MPRYLSPTAVHSLPPYYAEHHPYSRVERHSPAPTLVAHSSPLRSYSPHHGPPSHHVGLPPIVPPPSFHTSRSSSFAPPSGKEMYPYVKGKKVSPEQLADLLALFAQDDNPSKEQRTYHANRLKMSFKALSIWFQNERANVKKGRVRVCTPISGSSPSRPSLLHIRTTTTPIRDQVQSATTDGSSPLSPYNNSHVLLRGTPCSSYPSFGGSGVGRSHQQRPHGLVGANPREDVNISRNDNPPSGSRNSISMILNDTTSHVTDNQNRNDGRPAVVPAPEDEADYQSDGESRYSASSSEYAHDSDETTQVITPVMPISKELAPIINVSPPGCSLPPSRARGGRLDDEGLMVAEILAGMKRSASP